MIVLYHLFIALCTTNLCTHNVHVLIKYFCAHWASHQILLLFFIYAFAMCLANHYVASHYIASFLPTVFPKQQNFRSGGWELGYIASYYPVIYDPIRCTRMAMLKLWLHVSGTGGCMLKPFMHGYCWLLSEASSLLEIDLNS